MLRRQLTSENRFPAVIADSTVLELELKLTEGATPVLSFGGKRTLAGLSS